MKNSSQFFQLLVVVLLLLPTNKLKAQWADISPPKAAGIHLFDVEFFNHKIGFAVGQEITSKIGHIFKTTDGGETWSNTTYENSHLRSVAYTSEKNWIVSGYDGPSGTHVIWLRSTDQGDTWNKETDSKFKGVNSLQFLDDKVGFAIGYGSEFGTNAGVMKTTDGGTIWTYQYDGTAIIAGGGHFANAFTGHIAFTSLSLSGSVAETNDGGATYTVLYEGDWMHDVSFHDGGTAYVLEGLTSKSVVKSTSYGGAWESGKSVDGRATGLEFISSSGGYILGEGGLIAKTVDGGDSWTDESPESSGKFEQMCVKGEYAYVCSSAGEVYRTKHGITLSTKKAPSQINRVSVFPNPVSAYSSLKVSGTVSDGTIFSLRDYTGRTVFESTVESNQVSLDRVSLTSGLYIYHLDTGKRQLSGRLTLR